LDMSSRQMRRLLSHKSVLLLITSLLLFGGWEVYGRLSAQTRLMPAVHQALERDEQLDVVLKLPFAPEQFHVKLLQQYGTVSGVQSTSVIIRRITPDKLRELSKSYWIERIDLEER
jgi:hypothetical protein